MDARADNRGRSEEPGAGGVAVLEDTDGDGRMDQRTTFATGLISPCGILLVGDVVVVLDPPHFWFLRDRDGDSVSDERTKIAVDNTERPDRAIGLNGLVLAIDNWIYSAASTVCVRYVDAGNFIADRTIRRAGGSITQDETGRLYYGGDGNMLYFDPITPAYLWRNPGYRAGGTGIPVPRRTPPGGAPGIPEFSPGRSESEPAMSAGGAIIYRGRRFGPEFEGNVFVPEPDAGRVGRSPLQEAEDEVPGRPVRPAIEVLHSTDPHFRPVSLAQGPDAALYMVDSPVQARE